MRHSLLHIVLLTLLSYSGVLAQLSPGKLSKSHADLEGIRNCTKCHVLGNKVDDKKCLECHEEIQTLINQKRGYHSSKEVRAKDCAQCHSEHHGRNFDMMRFDEDEFDHNLTGYELTGAHQRTDCRTCHISDYIADAELRQRENTFLGLEQDCVSCHEDVHQNTLSTNDCASCHSTEEFAPAEFFDHDVTDYSLKGKHQDVDCKECHPIETRKGKEFQRFADIPFNNCIDCHDDVHDNTLGTNCKQCHNENSFTSLRTIKRFNHNTTNFPLKGAHKKVDCRDCHNMDVALNQMFQDQLGVATNDCIQCHEDVHENKFGSNCVECHNEKAWVNVDTDEINHNLTDFPLRGKHEPLDCRECHSESLTEPVEHNTCATCHTDYHEGEFFVNGLGPDCAECHNEEGFTGSLYTIEQHNTSKFPLDGAHIATPCFACHLPEGEEKWTFRNIGERCVDCHEDVHKGYIAESYYPNQDCEQCHITEDWTSMHFDHNKTGYELLGKHQEASCMECHGLEANIDQHPYAGFLNAPNECYQCHQEDNSHEDQFVENGVTDCARCHDALAWTINDFDHDDTAFKLDGAHAKVDCKECHKPYQASNGNIIIQYKYKSFECIDCHQ